MYRIVKQSGGYVWLGSEPEKGTTVRIHLPEAESVPEEEPVRLAPLARANGQVDLVLSDVVMPRMGGKELDEALRKLRPDLPLLYMSGYPGQEVAERGLLDPTASFVQKPFAPEELAERVRGMLDGRAPSGRD